MRLWYARRAVPWASLLGCLAVAGALAATVHRWEQTASLLLPLAVAATASAGGFVLDERSADITSVTPRGGRWATTTRLGVLVLPLVLWAVLASTLPEPLALDLGGWWLVGLASCLLAVGLAGLARRRVGRPGTHVASALVLLATLPLLVGPFLRWEPLFPLGSFPGWLLGLWLGVGAVGAALAAVALRPDARPSTFSRRSVRRHGVADG